MTNAAAKEAAVSRAGAKVANIGIFPFCCVGRVIASHAMGGGVAIVPFGRGKFIAGVQGGLYRFDPATEAFELLIRVCGFISRALHCLGPGLSWTKLFFPAGRNLFC